MSSYSSSTEVNVASFPPEGPTAERSTSLRTKLVRPTSDEDARIAEAITTDPDAAPDISEPLAGVIRRGRPIKSDRKVSVTLRLDRAVVERFKATGAGWQTWINAALKNREGA